MTQVYNRSYFVVNNPSCFTLNKCGCILETMKFNERLMAARKYAGLTQQQLIEKLPAKADGKPMMSQANLAKMEKNPNTIGSNNSYYIAKACNVSVEWLISGDGDMHEISNELTTHLKVMQELPDYARTDVEQYAIKTAQLIAKAQASTPSNGTTKQ